MGNNSSKTSIRLSLILSLGIGMVLVSVVMTFIIGRTVLRSNKEQITKSIITLSEAKSISVERRMTEVVNAAEALAGVSEDVRIIAEPGRFIAAPAMIGICSVTGKSTRFGKPWYYLDDGVYFSGTWCNSYHLWTIKDAKEGDVLSYETDEGDIWIMIYWSLYEPYEGHVHYHALLVNDDFTDKGTCCICIDDLKPATIEQHELLFRKMKEEGYQWDKNKKELIKL